jgi:hypothetical protein
MRIKKEYRMDLTRISILGLYAGLMYGFAKLIEYYYFPGIISKPVSMPSSFEEALIITGLFIVIILGGSVLTLLCDYLIKKTNC